MKNQLKSFAFSLTIVLGVFSANAQVKVKVNLVGNTNQIMKMKDLHANINPDTISNKKHLYAIGAAENLQGEMMVIKGKPYFTGLTTDRKPLIEKTFNKKMIFMVSANISKWESQKITKHIASKDELIQIVFEAASKHGIDTTSGFPFMIKGNVKSLKGHIAFLKDEHIGNFSPQVKKDDDYPVLVENKKIQVLGFASTDAGGRFAMPAIGTKAASKMHIHFISKDESSFGHVEDLSFDEEIKLYFPKN